MRGVRANRRSSATKTVLSRTRLATSRRSRLGLLKAPKANPARPGLPQPSPVPRESRRYRIDAVTGSVGKRVGQVLQVRVVNPWREGTYPGPGSPGEVQDDRSAGDGAYERLGKAYAPGSRARPPVGLEHPSPWSFRSRAKSHGDEYSDAGGISADQGWITLSAPRVSARTPTTTQSPNASSLQHRELTALRKGKVRRGIPAWASVRLCTWKSELASRSDTFDMMRLWSRVRSRSKGRPCAAPSRDIASQAFYWGFGGVSAAFVCRFHLWVIARTETMKSDEADVIARRREFAAGLDQVAQEAPDLRQLGKARLQEAIALLAQWPSAYLRGYGLGLRLLLDE